MSPPVAGEIERIIGLGADADDVLRAVVAEELPAQVAALTSTHVLRGRDTGGEAGCRRAPLRDPPRAARRTGRPRRRDPISPSHTCSHAIG